MTATGKPRMTNMLSYDQLRAMTPEQYEAHCVLEAERQRIARNMPGKMKVSEKGALSIYGMGRFPVTLYKDQWLALFQYQDQIKAFINANAAALKSKGD